MSRCKCPAAGSRCGTARCLSVIAVRVFSISTGLATSTVTPGSTAPDASLTTPAIATCAQALVGISSNTASAIAHNRCIFHSSPSCVEPIVDVLELLRSCL